MSPEDLIPQRCTWASSGRSNGPVGKQRDYGGFHYITTNMGYARKVEKRDKKKVFSQDVPQFMMHDVQHTPFAKHSGLESER